MTTPKGNSRRALRNVNPKIPTIRQRVFVALDAAGTGGLTDVELVTALGGKGAAYSSARTRRGEMVEDLEVFNSGLSRTHTYQDSDGHWKTSLYTVWTLRAHTPIQIIAREERAAAELLELKASFLPDEEVLALRDLAPAAVFQITYRQLQALTREVLHRRPKTKPADPSTEIIG